MKKNMKTEKYNIDPDFKLLTLIHPPLNRSRIQVIQRVMRLSLFSQMSDLDVKVERIRITTDSGNTVRALLYEPKKEKTKGCLVYFHGGGYVFPAAQYQYRLARIYAKETGCRVLFPDYRLAPGNPFPAAVEDCFAAYKWMRDHMPGSPIAVCGDSAGGTLSMAVCLMADDCHVQVPCAQLLMYPYVGHCGETESLRLFEDAPVLSGKAIATLDEWYVPDPSAGKIAYWSPIEAESVDIFPITYIEAAEYDGLRDGALLYAKKLHENGISVELHNIKGAVHGYDLMLSSKTVKRLVARRIRFLKKAFSTALASSETEGQNG